MNENEDNYQAWDGWTGPNDLQRAEGKSVPLSNREIQIIKDEIIAAQRDTRTILNNQVHLKQRLESLPGGDTAIDHAIAAITVALSSSLAGFIDRFSKVEKLVESLCYTVSALLKSLETSQKETNLEALREIVHTIVSELPQPAPQQQPQVDDYWIKAAQIMPREVEEKLGISASQFKALYANSEGV